MTERKFQIKRAGLAVFARYGLRRASMQDVAREAGLSRPALYQYFRNKDDLIAGCFDLVTEDGFALAETALSGTSGPAQRTSTYLIAYMTYYHRWLFSGPHSEEVLELKSRFGPEKMQPIRARLAARLNELAGRGPDDELGIILSNASEGLKLLAPDEAALARRLNVLVMALLAA